MFLSRSLRFARAAVSRALPLASRRLVTATSVCAAGGVFALASVSASDFVHAAAPAAAVGTKEETVTEPWSDTKHAAEINVQRGGKSFDLRAVGVAVRAVPADA